MVILKTIAIFVIFLVGLIAWAFSEDDFMYKK
jgi:hypothetical protein